MIEFYSYYLVDNEKFLNKNQAIVKAKGDLSRIKLHFNESVWDNVDWTLEPQESWQELYKQKVLEIREKYDHVALWYSGGYDSKTILETFIRNNVLLDELVVLDRSHLYTDLGMDYTINTLDHIKKNYYNNIKINIIKHDISAQAKLYADWGTDWIWKMRGSTSRMSKTNKTYFIDTYDFSQKTLQNRSNRCDIFGHEKCKVYIHDNKWYSFFTDNNLGDFNSNVHIDFFYDPKIYIKQVHNVISWFESLKDFTPDLVHDIQGRDRSLTGNYIKYYAEWNIAMGRYPLNSFDFTSCNGLQKVLHSEDTNSKDSIKILTYSANHDKHIYDIYMNGFNELKNQLEQFKLGINPTILSKPYFIRQAKLAI